MSKHFAKCRISYTVANIYTHIGLLKKVEKHKSVVQLSVILLIDKIIFFIIASTFRPFK